MIVTNRDNSIGFVLRRNSVIDGDITSIDKKDVITYSGPNGWSCAQVLKNISYNNPEYLIVGLIPMKENSGKKFEKTIALIQRWLDLINTNTIDGIVSLGKIIDTKTLDNIHERIAINAGKVKENNYWLPVIQKVPGKEKWPSFMNLAIFSMVRYLYRAYYAGLAQRTMKIMEVYKIPFFWAMYVATVTGASSETSDTFLIHYKYSTTKIPREDFSDILNNLGNGIQLTFTRTLDGQYERLTRAFLDYQRKTAEKGILPLWYPSAAVYQATMFTVLGYKSNGLEVHLKEAISDKDIERLIKILKYEKTGDWSATSIK